MIMAPLSKTVFMDMDRALTGIDRNGARSMPECRVSATPMLDDANKLLADAKSMALDVDRFLIEPRASE